jgi:hypothetical protein
MVDRFIFGEFIDMPRILCVDMINDPHFYLTINFILVALTLFSLLVVEYVLWRLTLYPIIYNGTYYSAGRSSNNVS